MTESMLPHALHEPLSCELRRLRGELAGLSYHLRCVLSGEAVDKPEMTEAQVRQLNRHRRRA